MTASGGKIRENGQLSLDTHRKQEQELSLTPPPLPSQPQRDNRDGRHGEGDGADNGGGPGPSHDSVSEHTIPENTGTIPDGGVLRFAEPEKQEDKDGRHLEEEQRKLEQSLEDVRKTEVERIRMIEEAHRKAVEATEAVETSPGCLTTDGAWTTDRALCATNTTTDLRGTAEARTAIDQVIERKMDQRFSTDRNLQRRQEELLNIISRASQRLTLIRDGTIVAAEHAEFLNQSIAWLQGGHDYFSSTERTAEEMKLMATYIQQVLDHAASLVESARSDRGPAPDIAGIYRKTETILSTFPDILLILTAEGIPQSDAILNNVSEAVSLYPDIRDACSKDREACGRLREVLDRMERAQLAIRAALEAAGKPEVEERIRALVQSRLSGT